MIFWHQNRKIIIIGCIFSVRCIAVLQACATLLAPALKAPQPTVSNTSTSVWPKIFLGAFASHVIVLITIMLLVLFKLSHTTRFNSLHLHCARFLGQCVTLAYGMLCYADVYLLPFFFPFAPAGGPFRSGSISSVTILLLSRASSTFPAPWLPLTPSCCDITHSMDWHMHTGYSSSSNVTPRILHHVLSGCCGPFIK